MVAGKYSLSLVSTIKLIAHDVVNKEVKNERSPLKL